MKRLKINMAAAAIGAVVSFSTIFSGCDAMWDSSVDGGSGYYGVGISSDWYPALPGAPLLSPVYWGGQVYPGGLLPPQPVFRPNRPVWNVPPANPSIGNVRPGANQTPSQPSQPSKPIVPPAGTIRPGQVTGGEPGVVMPPAGSGMRPASTGRH